MSPSNYIFSYPDNREHPEEFTIVTTDWFSDVIIQEKIRSARYFYFFTRNLSALLFFFSEGLLSSYILNTIKNLCKIPKIKILKS